MNTKGRSMAEKFDITAKVTALVLEQFEEQPSQKVLAPTTHFADLGLDWLGCTQLIMSLEEEFSIIISDQEATELVSIQAIVAYLQAHISR